MATCSSAHLRRGEPPRLKMTDSPLRLGLHRSVSRREMLIGSIAGTAAMLATAALQGAVLPRSEVVSHSTTGWSPYPAASVPMSLSSLDPNLFVALVGECFTATAAGQSATLVLRDVTVAESLGERPRELRQAGFSLMFEVASGELTESGIVTIENPQIGWHDLFLHRVGLRGDSTPRYEAVFN